MTTRSSILAWEILWTEEPGELQFMELQRVGHNLAPNSSTWLNDERLERVGKASLRRPK